jgi:hypothetical protein
MSRDPNDDMSDEQLIRAVLPHWRKREQLAELARRRVGYLDTDGYFGITYPEELEPDDDLHIPPGHIAVLAGYGDPHSRERLVREEVYLRVLADYLSK